MHRAMVRLGEIERTMDESENMDDEEKQSVGKYKPINV